MDQRVFRALLAGAAEEARRVSPSQSLKARLTITWRVIHSD